MTAAPAKLHLLGGAGPDLVFVHGFGADRYAWAANAPALMDVARVWAVDLPGHGAADNVVGSGDPSVLAESLLPLMAQISGPAVVVGHSLGGAVAVHLSRLAPHLLRHLVLLAPAGLGAQLDHGFLADFPNLTSPEDAQSLLERLVERKRLIAPAMVAHVLAELQEGSRRAALAQIARALAQMPPLAWPDLRADVIWGESDRINAPPMAVGRDVLRLPNIGHLPYVEAASKVNAIIRAAVLAARV